MGYSAGAIHGDFTQSHRDEMMDKFRKGDIDILVATDVATRGLDIPDVSHVVNYSIPQNPDGYIHRIGRTGRIGKSGIAIDNAIIYGRKIRIQLAKAKKRQPATCCSIPFLFPVSPVLSCARSPQVQT